MGSPASLVLLNADFVTGNFQRSDTRPVVVFLHDADQEWILYRCWG
jgi:hypothetical protein